MNELNHGAGKGDKERSPGWRNNYDDIVFPKTVHDGFFRVNASRIRKVYGQPSRVEVRTCDCTEERS